MIEPYRIRCCRCRGDLTEKIAKHVESTIKKITEFLLSDTVFKKASARVNSARTKTTCPSCGYRGEYEIDLIALARLALERMK
jgi:hypothetical protein